MHQLIIRSLQSFQRYLLTRSFPVREVQTTPQSDNRFTSKVSISQNKRASRGTRGHLEQSRGRNWFLKGSLEIFMIIRELQGRKSSRDHSPIIDTLRDRKF